MKAWILKSIGQFELAEQYALPSVKADEVLIKVSATGICGSDIQRVYQTGAHRMPLIIGHEFTGTVVALGEGVTSSWLHQRVAIFPLLPCKQCASCQKEQYELCQNYSYLGSRQAGGFAEYVAVPVWNLLPLPEEVSAEQAAMLEPMAVAVHAIRRVKLTPESKIVVCGLGTIGLLVCMFLIEQGYDNLFVIGNKGIQKEMVCSLGLAESHYCDSKSQEVDQWITQHVHPNGADVFFECVGKSATIQQALTSTTFAGQICLVGNPYGRVDLLKDCYWRILRRQLTVTGTWNSTFLGTDNPACVEDDWHYCLEKLKQKRIMPEQFITHRYTLETIAQGFTLMHEKRAEFVKVMMKVEDL